MPRASSAFPRRPRGPRGRRPRLPRTRSSSWLRSQIAKMEMEMGLLRSSLFVFFPVMKLAARLSRLFFLGMINLVLTTTTRTSRRKSMDSGLRQFRPLSPFAKKERGVSAVVSLASGIGGSSVGIPARHFSSLMPKRLVTDEVVNTLISIFQAKNTAAVASGAAQRRSHFCSSFFLQQRIAFGVSGFDENSARRWAEKCPGGDIRSLERAFVPVSCLLSM